MRKAGPARSGYAQVVAERDQAVADRDFLLSIFNDLGASADIIALAVQVTAVRAMVSNVPPLRKSRSNP